MFQCDIKRSGLTLTKYCTLHIFDVGSSVKYTPLLAKPESIHY